MKNSLFYLFGNLITAFSTFLLLPIITNRLGADNYGIVNLMQTFSTVLIIFMTVAVDRSLFRVYYDYKTEKERNEFLSTIFYFVLTTGSFVAVLCFVFRNLLEGLFDSIPFFPFFAVTVSYTFLQMTISFTQIIRQIRQHAKMYIVISLILFFLSNGLALLFLIRYQMGAMSVLYGTLGGCLLTWPFAFWSVRRIFVPAFRKEMLRDALIFAYPMLFSLIFSWVLNMSDRVFLVNYISQSAVGLYSLGAKFSSLIVLFAAAVFQAYNPLFYKKTNTLPVETAKSELKRINNLIIVLIGYIALGVFAFSPEILACFFSSEYAGSLVYIRILTFSCFLLQIVGLFNVMVYQNKKTLHISLGIVSAGTLSLILNYLFIPRIGALMAAYSNLTVSAFLFVYMFFLARRNYYIPVNFKAIGYFILSGAAIYATDYFGKEHLLVSFLKKGLLLVGCTFLAVRWNIFEIDIQRYYWGLKSVICKKWQSFHSGI